MEMGKQKSRTIPGLFFIFQGLNFFPILYNTTYKSALFSQPEAAKWKGGLDFFDSDIGDKNRDYRTHWIEYRQWLEVRIRTPSLGG